METLCNSAGEYEDVDREYNHNEANLFRWAVRPCARRIVPLDRRPLGDERDLLQASKVHQS